MLGNKTNGTFVDIGCGSPFFISNTALLETQYNWSGIGIDLDPHNKWGGKETKTWDMRSHTRLYIENAITFDYKTAFEENKFESVIDLLCMDLEPPSLTLECLYKIPFDYYKFRVVVFETDEYRDGGKERVAKSREHLTKYGYKLKQSLNQQDEIYIHPDLT